MLTLGALAFASPWVLAALLGLPLLWLLLRVTPPAPRVARFPAIRLLRGLEPREETPDAAPWWLLLLRLAMAALAVLALARPLLNADEGLSGEGPVTIVVDDDWAAGRDWPRRAAAMEALVERAGRRGREVVLVPTAGFDPREGPSVRPLPAGRALDLARAMEPKPWPVRLGELAEALEADPPPEGGDIVWLSNGVADPGEAEAIEILRRRGGLTVVAHDGRGPRIALAPDNSGGAAAVEVARPAAGPAAPVAVRAVARDGRVLARTAGAFAAGERRARLEFRLPAELRNDIGRIEVEGEAAGGVALLDDGFARRSVGLVAESGFRGAQPLLDELHYLEGALAPFAEVTRGRLEELLASGVSATILADSGALPEVERVRLAKWIEAGGALIRFAGPKLAAAGLAGGGRAAEALSPVRLRAGDRTLGGALSWSRPLAITGFAPDGPLAGMDAWGEATVRRQVLAEPSVDLAERTWARLSDGTPIVTGRPMGRGWLVLFHTTASPEWSDLALSGLFVDMLRRLVGLGSGAAVRTKRAGALAPLETLDGFGRLGPPPATAGAWSPAPDGTEPRAGPGLPPGYYGTEASRRAFNLSIDPDALAPQPAPPPGVAARTFAGPAETDLAPFLLLAAFALFLADFVATMALRGYLPVRRAGGRAAAAALLALALAGAVAAPRPAAAQTMERPGDAFALEATLETRLAYVVVGDEEVDRVSQAGLASLSDALARRTAVEPGPPMGVDLEADELAFFALLYWPVPPGHPPLSDEAARRVNAFMRNGGAILFDTRDRFESAGGAGGSGMRRLRELGRSLEIPALAPAPPGHVLTRAFYLLDEFPGRYAGGAVWVRDDRDAAGAGEVTPVILGGHDWSGAWARGADGGFAFPVVPGGEAQREYAFRFGVNLVMYALTGKYKADQVHVPSILERLGQ